MSVSDDLARLVREEVERVANPFQIMVVDSVQDDGTVNLRWGTTILNGIPANRSYSPRAEDDVVLVLKHEAGWRVMDRVGGPVNLPDVDQIDLAYGPPAPNSSFVKAQTVWVKDGALYVQTGEGPGSPDPGSPPVASKPKPVTVSPDWTAGYRSGSRDGSMPAQSAWSSYPKAWSGAWGYGNAITEACAGKSVKSMQARIARTGKRHGVSGKVRPQIGTHTHASRPNKTPSISRKFTGPGLGLGESKWITLPGNITDALATGAAKGLAIGARASNSDYLVSTTGCGEIRITFK